MKTCALAVCLTSLLLTGGRSAQAATITVNTTADELNSDGDCSLREAIQAANTNAAVDACAAGSGADVITVPAGTYTLSIAGAGELFNATGDLNIQGDLTINGDGAATTIIDGGDLDRVFWIGVVSTVQISNVTIRNGTTSNSGGGITIGPGSRLTVSNSTVSDNTASDGGGIAGGVTLNNSTVSNNIASNEGGGIAGGATLNSSTVSSNLSIVSGGGIQNTGTLVMNSSTVSNNRTYGNGGGIYNSLGATATLTSSTVSTNVALGAGGGGIYQVGGTATLTSSTVSDNTTGGNGGGIFLGSGTATVNDSTVSGNTATSGGGGGIFVSTATLIFDRTTISDNNAGLGGGVYIYIMGIVTLTNSTVSGNTAGGSGGGIYDKGDLTLNNSTVSDNTAPSGAGGGISAVGPGPVNLKNTIVAISPSGGDCRVFGTWVSHGHNLSSDATCQFTSTGDLPSTNPMLLSLANYGGPTLTQAPQSGSSAINTGSSDCPPPDTDQRGFSRPPVAPCDIGSVEFGAQLRAVGGVTALSGVDEPGGSSPWVGVLMASAIAALALSSIAWWANRRRSG